ncbi:hypothetical protein LTR94_028716, partial [Friedmanniomyces endolithicus]
MMALVTPNLAADHRLSGLINALAVALADKFDLTLISESGSISQWLRANCDIKERGWFATHADRFHHILYVADYMADADFRRLMQRYKGTVVLAERLSYSEEAKLVGRRLFDGAELAVFDAQGFNGLTRATGGQLTPADMVEILIRDMSERAAEFYMETDARAEHAARLEIIPTTLSKEARKAVCDRVGTDDASDIVVAIAQDNDTASTIIQNFRTACVGM